MSQPSQNNEWQPCQPGAIGDMLATRAAQQRQKWIGSVVALLLLILIPTTIYISMSEDSDPIQAPATAGFDPYSYVHEVNCQKALEALARFEEDKVPLEELPENFIQHVKRCKRCRDDYEAQLAGAIADSST